MKLLRLSTVAGLALVLAACPADDQRADVGMPADTPLTQTDPAVAPTAPAAMSERLELGEMNNSGVTGEAVVTDRNNQVEVQLTVRGARPNATSQAHIHRGSCDAQGPVVAPLEAVNTDATGMGTSVTTVGEAPMTIMNGQHYVQVHAAGGDPGPPTACGDIPAHRM